MARWATLIEQRRQEKPVLLVDAGDFCPSVQRRHQHVTDRYFFQALGRIGYDAIGVGETDIRYGRKRLLERMKRDDLPLVSSNIIDKRGGGHIVDPYIIRSVGGRRWLFWRRGGIKIGILSVVLPVYIHSIDEKINKFYDIRNITLTALETASTLREKGCDLVIALSHLGWENSRTFAETVPGIDVVINGHRAHTGLHHEFAGKTLVIDTGLNRSSFAEIEVTLTDTGPKFKAQDMARVLLSLEGDPYFLSLEKSYEQEMDALKKGPGGRTP
jgi:5'-nucleotidase